MQPIVKYFDKPQDYSPIWQQMREFTDSRCQSTKDEIWLLEHHPVYTQGQAGKAEHILNPNNIAIVQSDRGGQVTYHGPGQLMVYLLYDLKRLKIGIRALVNMLEDSIIELLATYNIKAHTKQKAPGVYVDGDKICSLGLRVRKGCSYHGLCLNINGDLSPYAGINPCGYSDLKMIQISDLCKNTNFTTVSHDLKAILLSKYATVSAQNIALKEN